MVETSTLQQPPLPPTEPPKSPEPSEPRPVTQLSEPTSAGEPLPQEEIDRLTAAGKALKEEMGDQKQDTLLTEAGVEPQKTAPDSAAKPEMVSRMQYFLQDQAKIPYDKLSESTRQELANLENEQDPKVYVEKFNRILRTVEGEVQSQLDEVGMKRMSDLKEAIAQGAIKPEEMMKGLKGYMEDAKRGRTPEEQAQITEAQQGIDQIEEEMKKPEEQRDQKKVKEGSSKILSVLKIIGLILAALLSLGVAKGAIGSGGGGH
jgi:hypothetical protein